MWAFTKAALDLLGNMVPTAAAPVASLAPGAPAAAKITSVMRHPWFSISIIGGIFFWAAIHVFYYNNLINMEFNVKAAWAQVENQLQRRFDRFAMAPERAAAKIVRSPRSTQNPRWTALERIQSR